MGECTDTPTSCYGEREVEKFKRFLKKSKKTIESLDQPLSFHHSTMTLTKYYQAEPVKLPEVKQIGCKRTSSYCGKSSTSEESIKLPFSLPKINHSIGEWNKITSDLWEGSLFWPQRYFKCSVQYSEFFLYLTRG